MALRKLANAELRVKALEPALDFHINVMGLVELGRSGGKVYLGCGTDDNFDLALTEGGTGVPRFSMQADDESLDALHSSLEKKGVKSRQLSDPAPGIKRSVALTTPSGHELELSSLYKPTSYLHPASGPHARRGALVPIDVDHITLRVGDTVEAMLRFLTEALGFKASDIFETPAGAPMAAWLRVGDYHHDVAMFGGRPGDTLDHLAWTFDGIEHVKKMLDRLSRAGIQCETGPGRHGIGGNIYAYFWAPGGNRYELSAEMPRYVDPGAPAGRWQDFPRAFSAWGATPPQSFEIGS